MRRCEWKTAEGGRCEMEAFAGSKVCHEHNLACCSCWKPATRECSVTKKPLCNDCKYFGGPEEPGMRRYQVTVPVTLTVETADEETARTFAVETITSTDFDQTNTDASFVSFQVGEAVVGPAQRVITDDQYRDAAFREWNIYDDIKFVDESMVTRTGKGYALVQAWVRVYDSEVTP